MKINLDHIRDDVDKAHVNEDTLIRDINYFTSKHNRNKLQDTCLWGMILSMKSGVVQQQSRLSQTNQGNKRMRTGGYNNKPFNRYAIVADLSNPPHTYAITTTTVSDTNHLLRSTFFDSFLGMSFYLIEPELTKNQVSNYTHILPCDEQELLPLKWNLKLARPTPIVLPPTVNETFYFILDNCQIDLLKPKVVPRPCCTGYQCDRQKKKECLCVHSAYLSPITYEFDVELTVDPRVFQGQETQTSNFRSYRTTSVFFKNFVEFSGQTVIENERKKQTKRRKQIADMVAHINERCGWKVVGWVRRGEVSVEGEQEKVENTEVNLNLTYLFPSEDDILCEDEFRALQIDYDGEEQAEI